MNLSAEDEHLNKYLRAQIYGGDPMAQYILEKALKNNRIAMVVVKTLRSNMPIDYQQIIGPIVGKNIATTQRLRKKL